MSDDQTPPPTAPAQRPRPSCPISINPTQPNPRYHSPEDEPADE